MTGIEIRRPSIVRWESSSAATPFVIDSKVMQGRQLKVWRTDGYTGTIPRSDWSLLTEIRWAPGKVHHIQNFHDYGYTRYDVMVIPPPPPPDLTLTRATPSPGPDQSSSS